MVLLKYKFKICALERDNKMVKEDAVTEEKEEPMANQLNKQAEKHLNEGKQELNTKKATENQLKNNLKKRKSNTKKSNITKTKLTVTRVFAYFVIYSVIGYVIEMTFALITKGVLESRKSFLYGPFCAIYGLGATTMIIGLQKFNKNNYTLFFGRSFNRFGSRVFS